MDLTDLLVLNYNQQFQYKHIYWILQEKREDEDEGSLLKAMSDSDLLALKKQFKSIKRVVKIIDDILEERE